jgi:tRNA(Ile)-lysidine synthase
MLHKVQKYIHKLININDFSKIIVGVSGGPDSVALLHILNKLGYECIAAHCNFNLRKDESKRDELFVRNLCDTLKIKLEYVEFDTKKYAKCNKQSIEMAARQLRYEWFEKIRIDNNAEAIATGHHADDNAETMLLNLIRGTGIKGLSGIPPINGKIIRPLLTCTRKEILKYLHDNNLTFITDSTNLQNDFSRNKIRNQVIPILKKINPSVQHTFSKSIYRFRELQLFYEQCIEEKIADVVHKSENQTLINIKKLCLNSSPALILYEILYPMGFHPDVIEKVFENLQNESGKLFYSQNYRLLKDRNFLIITANEDKSNLVYNISHIEDTVFTPFEMKIEQFERKKYSH